MNDDGSSGELSSPGIKFGSIDLLACTFRANSKPKKLKHRLELTSLDRKVSERDDGSGSDLICIFGFDLMYGMEDAPCELRCKYLATYFRANDANMTWDKFSDGMALSHVVAYLREFVMNLTTRSVLPRLFLDPLNANALVQRYKERQSQTTAPMGE